MKTMNTLTLRVDFVGDDDMRNVYAYMDVVDSIDSIKVTCFALHTNAGDDFSEDDYPEYTEKLVKELAAVLKHECKIIEEWETLRDTIAFIPPNGTEYTDDQVIDTPIIPIKWNGYQITVQGYIRLMPRWDLMQK